MMKRSLSLLIALTMILSLFGAMSVSAAPGDFYGLKIELPNKTVVNGTVSADLKLDILGASPLAFAEFEVTYDSTQLTFAGFNAAMTVDAPDVLQVTSAGAGRLKVLVALVNASPIGVSRSLGKMNFTVLNADTDIKIALDTTGGAIGDNPATPANIADVTVASPAEIKKENILTTGVSGTEKAEFVIKEKDTGNVATEYNSGKTYVMEVALKDITSGLAVIPLPIKFDTNVVEIKRIELTTTRTGLRSGIASNSGDSLERNKYTPKMPDYTLINKPFGTNTGRFSLAIDSSSDPAGTFTVGSTAEKFFEVEFIVKDGISTAPTTPIFEVYELNSSSSDAFFKDRVQGVLSQPHGDYYTTEFFGAGYMYSPALGTAPAVVPFSGIIPDLKLVNTYIDITKYEVNSVGTSYGAATSNVSFTLDLSDPAEAAGKLTTVLGWDEDESIKNDGIVWSVEKWDATLNSGLGDYATYATDIITKDTNPAVVSRTTTYVDTVKPTEVGKYRLTVKNTVLDKTDYIVFEASSEATLALKGYAKLDSKQTVTRTNVNEGIEVFLMKKNGSVWVETGYSTITTDAATVNYEIKDIPTAILSDMINGADGDYMLRFWRHGGSGDGSSGGIREEQYLAAELLLGVDTLVLGNSLDVTIKDVLLYAGSFYLPSKDKAKLGAGDVRVANALAGDVAVIGETTAFDIDEGGTVNASDISTVQLNLSLNANKSAPGTFQLKDGIQP